LDNEVSLMVVPGEQSATAQTFLTSQRRHQNVVEKVTVSTTTPFTLTEHGRVWPSLDALA
jgi:hypothetical protein